MLATALLSAHMIVFWLSQDSNVTPPVCLASFTAAAIAKSPPMLTGFYSWKIAKGLYFVPFLIAFTPLMSGNWGEMLEVFGRKGRGEGRGGVRGELAALEMEGTV